MNERKVTAIKKDEKKKEGKFLKNISLQKMNKNDWYKNDIWLNENNTQDSDSVKFTFVF